MITKNQAILNDTPSSSDLLTRVIQICLWHEPHYLNDIIKRLSEFDNRDPISMFSFKRMICTILNKAIEYGDIKREKGFYLLTVQGRAVWSQRLIQCSLSSIEN